MRMTGALPRSKVAEMAGRDRHILGLLQKTKGGQKSGLAIGGRKWYVIVDDTKNGKEDPLRSLRGENVVVAAHLRRV